MVKVIFNDRIIISNHNTKLKEIEELHFNTKITFDGEEYLKSAPWLSNEFNLF